MSNSVQMLNVGLAVVLVLLVVAAARVIIAGYISTFGGQKFGYKFDRSRLPLCGRVIAGIIGIFFIYALVVSRQAGLALGYCIGISPLLMPGCLISVCYVSRDSIPKDKPKSSGKSKKNSWLA